MNERRNDASWIEPKVSGFEVLKPQFDVDEVVRIGDVFLCQREANLLRAMGGRKRKQRHFGVHGVSVPEESIVVWGDARHAFHRQAPAARITIDRSREPP
jgi:hypothetical protein